MTDTEPLHPVLDDTTRHRFVNEQEGGLSELVYRTDGHRMTLLHTAVPEKLRRRGIAAALVRAAIERAANEDLVVVPLCPYARKWLAEHPEMASTVKIDWAATRERNGPAERL
jgi:uncharacterized protein